MIEFRRFVRFLAVTTLMVCACGRERSPATSDTLASKRRPSADSTDAATLGRNWDRSAGPVLLVAADTPARAMVVVPDSASQSETLSALPRPASVTLFGRGGTVQTAELPTVGADSSGCVVATLSAAPPPRPWNVGFLGGVVSPIAMDSISSLTRVDSADALVEMTRLASALPNDTAGRFAGLPFVVRALWRFNIADGPQVTAAVLVRQINQEATPLQEHTLIIAERAPSDTTVSTVYSERSVGDEDTIDNRDVLAAASFGASHAAA
ncbi:MAG TPA: hypothetical protein VHV78_12970, partial [Gemmatimonadaceae bacterium]|nr:hypothetical protein [Gemmatimonadaceae bacterium]